jgi:hypothetical protein
VCCNRDVLTSPIIVLDGVIYQHWKLHQAACYRASLRSALNAVRCVLS